MVKENGLVETRFKRQVCHGGASCMKGMRNALYNLLTLKEILGME